MSTPSTAILDSPPQSVPAQGSMVRRLLGSTSALVVSMGLERGLGFLANLMAARMGGAPAFGAYSLGLTTANNIASYAGAGIGLTATRFSGQYAGHADYGRALAWALVLVSCVSAFFASGLLFWGAGPLARILLHNPSLTSLLQWAALPAGTMILMECCRGYLIGQRRLSALLCLSVVMGGSMLIVLPAASRRGPSAMIVGQASAMALAVLAAVIFTRVPRASLPGAVAPASDISSAPLAAAYPAAQPVAQPVAQMVRRIWKFGMVQLAGVIGLNAAGWWVASLVARSDRSLIQMGLFAVANQLRNMVALVPGLLSQSSYAMMAGDSGEDDAASRILAFSTFTSTLFSVAAGMAVILVLPAGLPMLYGHAYGAGVPVACIAVATAVIHMSAAPASARLTIVSLRASGYINAGWSLLVFALASVLVPRNGAIGAAAIYLIAHIIGAAFVLVCLHRAGGLPEGLTGVISLAVLASAGMAALACLRTMIPAWNGRLTGGVAALPLLILAQLFWLGRRHGWLPEPARIRHAVTSALRGRLRQ